MAKKPNNMTAAKATPTATDEQLEAMRQALRRVEAAEKNVETAKQQKKDKDGDLVAAEKELRRTVADIAGPPGPLFDNGQDDDGEK